MLGVALVRGTEGCVDGEGLVDADVEEGLEGACQDERCGWLSESCQCMCYFV